MYFCYEVERSRTYKNLSSHPWPIVSVICEDSQENHSIVMIWVRVFDHGIFYVYSGYAANVAVTTTLGNGSDVAIFSDALNHASIVDGCRLASKAGASLQIYRCETLC